MQKPFPALARPTKPSGAVSWPLLPCAHERCRTTVDLSIWSVALLAVAGFVAGAINAAAGGGSLVSFPALIAAGYPPLTANVTNNVAVAPGYVGGAVGYRRGLRGQRRRTIPLAIASVVGSLIGVGLVLVSSPGVFESIVPFLVLAACGLLAAQPAITRWTGERLDAHERPGIGALAGQTLVSAYGGYFSAALGVAVLAILSVFFEDTLQRLNALKAFLQLLIGVVSAVGFVLLTPVGWVAVAIIAPASVVGGEVGARLAQRVSDRALRIGVVAYGVAAAAWLFLR
jgi:uncharacterized protein